MVKKICLLSFVQLVTDVVVWAVWKLEASTIVRSSREGGVEEQDVTVWTIGQVVLVLCSGVVAKRKKKKKKVSGTLQVGEDYLARPFFLYFQSLAIFIDFK